VNKRDILISLARTSIAESIGLKHDLDISDILEKNKWLEESGASFVTLNMKKNTSLRGCIGSIIAHRKLYEDIIENAKNASLNDPRFPSLKQDEFDQISIEVSLLTQPVSMYYKSIDDLKSKINIGIDGVVLKKGTYQSTFLPQVWEQLPTFELFFSYLCQKAGLDDDCLKSNPEIFTYKVEKYREL
jgi:AmmeMemoRadiSam system protein A